MAKYHELVEKFKIEIAAVKAARADVDKIESMLKEEVDPDAREDLLDKLDCAYQAWDSEHMALSEKIAEEYFDVPFESVREKGISGFWQESGI